MTKRLLCALGVLALAAAICAAPASADTKLSYSNETSGNYPGDATRLYAAAAYLNLDGGASAAGTEADAVAFITGSVQVHHFLLGVAGKLDDSDGGCSSNYGDMITVLQGDYEVDVPDFAAGSPEATSLGIVKDYYCLNTGKALKASGTLLVFLSAVDAAPEGGLDDVAPPVPPYESVNLPDERTNLGTGDLTAGTYRATAANDCDVTVTDAADATNTNPYAAGDQIVLAVADDDKSVTLAPASGTCASNWQRIDTDRLDELDSLQDGIPTGIALVGVDLDEGRYRSIAASNGCVMQRMSNGYKLPDDGSLPSNQAFGEGQQVVVDIAAGDEALAYGSECGELAVATSTPLQPDVVVPSGHAIVGTDLEEGTYTSTAGDGGCTWIRLNGFGLEDSDTIAEQTIAQGDNVSIDVAATDAGLGTFGACGEFTKS